MARTASGRLFQRRGAALENAVYDNKNTLLPCAAEDVPEHASSI